MKSKPALVALAIAQFVMVLDQSVMNVSISALVDDFDTTVTTIQGVITLYCLVMAMFMMTGAKIGDRHPATVGHTSARTPPPRPGWRSSRARPPPCPRGREGTPQAPRAGATHAHLGGWATTTTGGTSWARSPASPLTKHLPNAMDRCPPRPGGHGPVGRRAGPRLGRAVQTGLGNRSTPRSTVRLLRVRSRVVDSCCGPSCPGSAIVRPRERIPSSTWTCSRSHLFGRAWSASSRRT